MSPESRVIDVWNYKTGVEEVYVGAGLGSQDQILALNLPGVAGYLLPYLSSSFPLCKTGIVDHA